MKYQLFSYAKAGDALERGGIKVEDKFFDLSGAVRASGKSLPGNCLIDDLLLRWTESHAQLVALAAEIQAKAAAFSEFELKAADIVWQTPLLRPGAIYCAGANYRDHVEAMGRVMNVPVTLDPKKEGVAPWHFLKAGRATLAPHLGEVRVAEDLTKLDWEAELAVIIGRRASHVAVEDALNYVAGYSCANDLSARDHFVHPAIEATSPFRFDWVDHKSFNRSCPLGPLLTPAEFVDSPENLRIKLWLNGEIRQDSNTSNHLYGVAEQISHLSRRRDLLPGDVILTGTPAGVGMESGVFLKAGDVTKVWIEGLGELQTSFV